LFFGRRGAVFKCGGYCPPNGRPLSQRIEQKVFLGGKPPVVNHAIQPMDGKEDPLGLQAADASDHSSMFLLQSRIACRAALIGRAVHLNSQIVHWVLQREQADVGL